MEIRIPHILPGKFEDLDSANIKFISEADIFSNIYSPLVDYDNYGEMNASLASSFWWVGNDAHIKIRDDFKTIDGWKITADDAAATLKRLMITATNTHAVLRDLIIDADKLKTINDNIAGIEVENGELIVRLKKQTSFFFQMLAAIDFVIIPKKCLEDKSLKIACMRNTTGLYYMAGRDKDNNIILEINKNHWEYKKNIPQKIILIKDERNDNGIAKSFDLFLNNKIDIIPKTSANSNTAKEELIQLAKVKNIDIDIFSTTPRMLTFIKFSERGLQLTKEQRLILIKDIQSSVTKNITNVGPSYNPTKLIFFSDSHVSMNSNQIKKMREVFDNVKVKNIGVEIEIGVYKTAMNLTNKLFASVVNKLKIVDMEKADILFKEKNISKQPHCIFGAQDLMFYQDLSLLTFSLKNDLFNIRGEQAEKFIEKFAFQDDKDTRLNMLRELEFSSLVENPSVIPLYNYGVSAVSRNGWKLNLSPYNGRTTFKNIVKEN